MCGLKRRRHRSPSAPHRCTLLSWWLCVGIAVLCAGLLGQPHAARADTVVFLGTQFTVERVVPLEHDQVKVELNGSAFIVPERDAGRAVAERYARNPALAAAMPWTRYLTFVGSLRLPDHVDLLKAAVAGVVSTETVSAEQATEFFEVLRRVDSSAQTVLAVLRATEGEVRGGAALCVAVRELDDAARAALVTAGGARAGARLLLRHAGVCLSFLRAGAVRHLARGRVAEARRDLVVARNAFLAQPELEPDLVAAVARLTALDEARLAADHHAFRAALTEASRDPLLAEAMKEGGTALVNAAARDLVARGEAEAALLVLAEVEFARRTVDTHEVLLEVIKRARLEHRSAFVQPKVVGVLREFVAKDEALTEQLLALASGWVTVAAGAGDFTGSQEIFGLLTQLRPDPNPANDQLRFAWAVALLSVGDLAHARDVVATAHTPIPPLLWLRLQRAEHPLAVTALLVLLFIIAGLLAVRWWMRSQELEVRGAGARESSSGDADATAVGDDEHHPPPRFVRYAPDLRARAVADEYAECLAVFGVRPGARLAQIKNAYRSAVKSCHPDLNRSGSKAQADRFIYLTKTYERLLDLHAERTGER